MPLAYSAKSIYTVYDAVTGPWVMISYLRIEQKCGDSKTSRGCAKASAGAQQTLSEDRNWRVHDLGGVRRDHVGALSVEFRSLPSRPSAIGIGPAGGTASLNALRRVVDGDATGVLAADGIEVRVAFGAYEALDGFKKK